MESRNATKDLSGGTKLQWSHDLAAMESALVVAEMVRLHTASMEP